MRIGQNGSTRQDPGRTQPIIMRACFTDIQAAVVRLHHQPAAPSIGPRGIMCHLARSHVSGAHTCAPAARLGSCLLSLCNGGMLHALPAVACSCQRALPACDASGMCRRCAGLPPSLRHLHLSFEFWCTGTIMLAACFGQVIIS